MIKNNVYPKFNITEYKQSPNNNNKLFAYDK